jgi:hypothetical protein
MATKTDAPGKYASDKAGVPGGTLAGQRELSEGGLHQDGGKSELLASGAAFARLREIANRSSDATLPFMLQAMWSSVHPR